MKLRATCLALLLAGWGEAAAQIDYISVSKSRVYDQTSATGIALKPAPCSSNCAFTFSASVGGFGPGSNSIGGIPAPSVSGPIASGSLGSFWNGGVMTFYPSVNNWYLSNDSSGEWNSPTQADLDAKFGSGIYALTVQGQTYPVNLSGDAYPAAPVMTMAGAGTWTGGKYVFDPRQPLTVTFSAPSFGPLGGLAISYACTNTVCVGATGSLVFPAHTFVEGSEPLILADFTSFVDQAFGPGGTPHSWAAYRARTAAVLKAQTPQVFPLTVTSNITQTVANASATFQPRPQDIGTIASVFVFAVAPSNRVLNAAQNKAAALAWRAEGATKDTPVQCVLAQLNSSGQLTSVSASSLQASITGILAAQAQSLGILNAVPTPNVAGSTFYVGYGSNGSAMLNNGITQRALTVDGDIKCDPKPPKTGWWWNTTEGGRGYSIEVAGNHIFFASYLYDLSGRSTWYVGSGNTSLDGSLFTGDLQSFSRGQTLGSAYRVPSGISAGSLTLAFADATHGTVIWPGGSVAIERYNIVQNGTSMNPMDKEPESGWWWNPEESGRGFFLEWQGGELFMAGYMYDDNGDPVWYLSTNTTPSTNLQSYSGSWWRYGNGQTLTGPYKPATRLDDNVAPVTITFQGAETALMTLPGGRTTSIRRFRF